MRLTANQKLQILKAYREEGGTLPFTEVLNQFRNGGDLPESGLPEKNATIVDANNNTQGSLLTGMMKARMAIASQMGNTSAQRMTSVSPKTYQFTGNEQINGEYIGVPKGEVGTHFMSSMGEFAVPFIQERDNKLQFVSNPRYNDPESMRFESPEDAEYFAEHYKDVAPMMQSFATGGEIPGDPPVVNIDNYIRNTSSTADNTNYSNIPLRKGEPPIIGGTLPTVEIKSSNTPKNYRNDPISRREDIKTVPITKSNMHDYPVSVQNEFMKQQVADRPGYEAIRDFANFAATGFGLAPIGILDDATGRIINTSIKYLPRLVNTVGDILEPVGSKLLPQAYKYNPFRFKPDLQAYYHRSPNLDNIINRNEGILQGFGESEAGRKLNESLMHVKGLNLNKGATNYLYFSKGVPLDYGRYNSIQKGMSGQGYTGPFLVEIKGVPMGASVKGRTPKLSPPQFREGYAVSHRPININEAKFYKEHWLQGYKEILNKNNILE